MSLTTITVLIIVAMLGYVIMAYRRFISLRTQIDRYWSEIEHQLRHQYESIPALVGICSEDNVSIGVKDILNIQKKALNARTIDEKAVASSKLSEAVSQMFTRLEAPSLSNLQLKENKSLLTLEDKLMKLDDAIQSSRRSYNAIVRDYNYRLESFPDRYIAEKYQYMPKEYFSKY